MGGEEIQNPLDGSHEQRREHVACITSLWFLLSNKIRESD